MSYMKDEDGNRLDEIPVKASLDENAQDIADHTADTANPHAVTKAQVGLANVDNTSDVNKPVSTAAQAALALKADLVDGVVPTAQIPAIALGTGQAVANRAAMLALTNVQPGDFVSITATADKGTYILNDPDPTVFAHWLALSVPTDVVQSVNGQNGVIVLGKGDVGLGSVDNTADADKPVSTATSTALGTKVPTTRTVNGHALSADVTVSKSDVGLGNVDNTSDLNKPVSTAQAAADAGLQTAIDTINSTKIGTLAYAENTCSNASFVTSITTSAIVVSGAVVTIQPTTADVWLRWGASLGVSVVGAGLITLRLSEVTDAGAQVIKSGPIRREVTAGFVTAFGPTFDGCEWRLGPTTTTRQFYLDAILVRESGSSLAAYLCNSYNNGAGAELAKTWLAAVAE